MILHCKFSRQHASEIIFLIFDKDSGKVLSGKALVLINEVSLHWLRLVLGRVSICSRVNHLGT